MKFATKTYMTLPTSP